MFAATGNHVETLRRVAAGALMLGELQADAWRALDAEDVARIFVAA